MDRYLAGVWDECCVLMLRATSSTAVLEEIDHEERTGAPVYPRPGTLRWGLAVCAASDCFEQFSPGVGMDWSRRFCCTTCGHRERYRQREATGLRQRAACIRAVVARRAARTDAGTGAEGGESRPTCCVIGCGADADWAIWDGVEPYHAHDTHACTAHVGALLTDAPEHRIYPIGPTDPGTGAGGAA